MRPTDWKSEFLLLFVVLVWGLNYPVVKSVLGVMHPHALNALRFTVSAAVLGGIYVHRARASGEALAAPLRVYLWPIAGLGLLNFVLYQFCFIVGLDHTKAGNAALIMASSPLWTGIVGAAFRMETLGRAAWAGLVVVFAGAVVIVVGGGQEVDFGSDTFVGNLLMLAGALFWGSYTALSRPVLRHVTPTGLSFLSLLFALPFLFALALPHLGDIAWARVSAWTVLAILFSGGLSVGLTITLWARAVRLAGASHTAVYGNLVPVIALLASALFLGEGITAVQVTGGALIIGGLLWMRRTRGHLR